MVVSVVAFVLRQLSPLRLSAGSVGSSFRAPRAVYFVHFFLPATRAAYLPITHRSLFFCCRLSSCGPVWLVRLRAAAVLLCPCLPATRFDSRSCCFFRRGGGEQLLTFALTVAVVVLAYVVARALQTVGLWATAVFITVVDVLLPSLVRLLCCLERHHNSVTHDLSVMNKVGRALLLFLFAFFFCVRCAHAQIGRALKIPSVVDGCLLHTVS